MPREDRAGPWATCDYTRGGESKMPGARWTEQDRDSLIQQVDRGRTLPQILIQGRTPASVNQQRQRLRNSGALAQLPKRPLQMWTIKEIRALGYYCMRYGLSAAEIAKQDLLSGRSTDSISQQMRRQGLGDPKRRRASAKAHRLNPDQRAELEEFVQTEGRKMASRELAERFKLAPSTITAYRRRLNLQLSWHEARDSEDYRRRQARWAKWRAGRRRALRQLERQLKGRGASDPERQCVRCQEHWLERNEFFALTKRTRRGSTVYTMSLACRACRTEQRR